MNDSGITIKPKAYVLSDSDIEKIHGATLDVLAQTGVQMQHPKAAEILGGAGARVEKDRIYLPANVVNAALNNSPSRVILGFRNRENTMILEGDQTWYGPCLDCLNYLDPLTNERRAYTADDCRINASLADGLPHYTWVMTLGLADDAPPEIADRVIARQALTYCEKPLTFCCQSLDSTRDIYQMSLAICGNERHFKNAPPIASILSPTSPLSLSEVTIERLLFCVEKDIPIIICPAPSAGSTSPATLAGTIVQANAESLSCLILAQTLQPGFPVIYGAMPSIMDMATTIFSYGAAELSLMSGAFCQMVKYYQLPSFGTGGCSDAKYVDVQAAVEATFSLLSASLTGANLIHDCGILDHGSVASPAYNVIINEVLGMIRRYERGIILSDETLALDVMDRVGPGGHFLEEAHTLNNFRNIWYPQLFERMDYDRWLEKGARHFEERLVEKTKQAMTHVSAPLSPEVIRELDRLAKHWK
jgi:trimethylamine--corrinoid protein Co-methyltransferase